MDILDIYLGVKLPVVKFWGTAKLFSKVAAEFYIPTSHIWWFQFFHILASILLSFITAILVQGVCGLLGTGSYSRRWAVGQWVKLHLSLAIAPHRSHYRLNHPSPTPICGKIIFHETCPWCQKCWGPVSFFFWLRRVLVAALRIFVEACRIFPCSARASL